MNYEEIQRLLAENRQEIGKREAEVPNIYNKYSPSTDPEIAAARAAQADKVKQLFAYDSQLAQTKFQPQAAPGPTATGAPPETPPEMILDPLIGLKAANTQTMATAEEAIDIGQRIAKRKDYLAESLDKALKLFQVGLEIKKAEQASLQDEMSNWFGLQDLILKQEEAKNKKTQEESKSEELMNFMKLFGFGSDLETGGSTTLPEIGLPPNYSPKDPYKTVYSGGKLWKYNIVNKKWEEVGKDSTVDAPPDYFTPD